VTAVTATRPGVLARGVRYVRDHGVVATARVALGAIGDRLYLDESHVWYSLDLGAVHAGRPLPEGLRLVRATAAETPSYVALGEASEASTRERLDAGASLWLVMEGPKTAFACWTFAQATPVSAARGGSLPLPEHCVCLEDSVTAPDFRGRGIAPAAWDMIAEQLRAEGRSLMITKVTVENTPSRRAVTKAGFVEFAIMRHRRVAQRRRVEVSPRTGALGIDLAGALPARIAPAPADV
jgi:GNAT superfamily N-acetyltransferase